MALSLAPLRSFHSTLSLTLPSPLPFSPPAPSACSLRALLSFPPELIVDPSLLPTHLRTAYYGAGELELPADRAGTAPTGVQLWLDGLGEGDSVQIKVDGRYLSPAAASEAPITSREVSLADAVVFLGWVCHSAPSSASDPSDCPSLLLLVAAPSQASS